MSLGAGADISKFGKQRISGKISKDNGTVAVDDFMGPVINSLTGKWVLCYVKNKLILYKDNVETVPGNLRPLGFDSLNGCNNQRYV